MSALSARDRANQEQRLASNPAVSTFVGASAGSGKTKLLTDRLLRLMLSGAKPERIQCLTFTRAAAAEMALRLHKMLGKWVTMGDAELTAELRALDVATDQATREAARSLFAKVLDMPGGMRIGTIHAFCQSLLRRFPLEAALSPHFRLIEERDEADALTEARETMLAHAASDEQRTALATIAGLASEAQFGHHVARLQGELPRLAAAFARGGIEAAQRRVLGVQEESEADIIAHAVNWQAEPALRAAAEMVAQRGSPQCAERAGRMLAWLELDSSDRAQHWERWCEEFLRSDGEPRAASGFINKTLQTQQPALAQHFIEEADRIGAVNDARCALKVAEISAALLTLARPVIDAYAAHKQAAGLLDYHDLIAHSAELLRDPGAAWVLYKLDGGLDHLLLDEVQDTSPEQWRIAHALTAEFFAGQSAREDERTVFAVGDHKQSIYSFQGADVDEFDSSHARLRARVESAGRPWREAVLDVSFRSTAPVLELVDRVFADPLAAAGVVSAGDTLRHYADRAEHAGSVELWPLVPRPDASEPDPWSVADRNAGLTSAPQRLATHLADWIATQTNGGTLLESRGRPLAPGDVLVLVRRRNDFARALVRALKARNVPVAGLDRMVLTEQPAVQDLIALGDALLLPQDDLSLANLLTSPLGGLTDHSLMCLAVGRSGSLAEALRTRAAERPDWQAAWDFFATLLARADYVPPYALLSEALGPLGGRARLLARLGREAAEPVDELLHAALAYADAHPPSLQGFLHWLRRSAAEVKREPEVTGSVVRVMTVHGAKGLQAPLVILPDTTSLPPEEGSILWASDPASGVDVPLWSPRRELRCRAADAARAAAKRRRIEEYNRLLYVAMTRAEDRLVVCGWQTRHGLDDSCWYRLVQRGFGLLPVVQEPFGDWDGVLLRHAAPQVAPVEPARAVLMQPDAALPAWAGSPPPAEPARPQRLAPSRPEGVGLGSVPAADSPLIARAARESGFRRGRLIHALLQHLPELPADQRAEAARRWLARPGYGLAEADADAVARQTLAVLDHPELAPLFGPGSRAEVPLTGLVGGQVVGGLVDRLALLPAAVLLADFKTNRRPPARIADTPVMYLRQMAAYRAVLRGVFPERSVACALVWTETGEVAMLPDALLDPHDPSHAGPAA